MQSVRNVAGARPEFSWTVENNDGGIPVKKQFRTEAGIKYVLGFVKITKESTSCRDRKQRVIADNC